MAEKEEPVKIMGNESNSVIETETTESAQPAASAGEANPASQQPSETSQTEAASRSSDEIATADGSLIETMDTALHNKPGVAEGEQVSGSSRADYYESRSYGKSDAEEELDALNSKPS